MKQNFNVSMHQQYANQFRNQFSHSTSASLKPLDPSRVSSLSPARQGRLTDFQHKVTEQQKLTRLPENHRTAPGTRKPTNGKLNPADRTNLQNLAKNHPPLNSVLNKLKGHKPFPKTPEFRHNIGLPKNDLHNGSTIGKLFKPGNRPMPNLAHLAKKSPGMANIAQKLAHGDPLSKADRNLLKHDLDHSWGADALNDAASLDFSDALQSVSDFLNSLAQNADGPGGDDPMEMPTDPGDDYSSMADGYGVPDNPGMPDGPGVGYGMIPDSGTPMDGDPSGDASPLDNIPDSPQVPPPAPQEPGLQTGNPLADIGSIADDVSPEQKTRYIRVANYSDQPVKLYLQYEALAQDGDARWIPGPAGGADAEAFEIAPGEVTDLFDDGWRINAARARLWATSGTRNLVQFKEKDLLLVPEKDDQGLPGYAAREPQTFFYAVF